MLSLKQDFPDIADEIIVAADSNEILQEALSDYEQACSRMDDKGVREDDRVQWAEIRAELVAEILRIFVRLNH